MNWPLSHEFNEAIQNPRTAFADPDLKGGETVVGATGLPLPRSGNFADVYQVRGADGREWAVKCFTRPVVGLADRYAKVSAALARAGLPFTVGFTFLAEGIRVGGAWRPVVKMEWVEGLLLNQVARENAAKPVVLTALGQMWGKLCKRLRESGIAHADVQHGNVLLVPGARAGAYGLKLIDYDGMWVPALANTPSGESGHPSYQHPARAAGRAYSPDVDRFPALVVATAFRGLALGGSALWEKYDNGDNLLFTEDDYKKPSESKLMKELWRTEAAGVQALVGRLALACGASIPQTPWLDQLAPDGEPVPLDDTTRRAAAAALGVALPVPVAIAADWTTPDPPTTAPAAPPQVVPPIPMATPVTDSVDPSVPVRVAPAVTPAPLAPAPVASVEPTPNPFAVATLDRKEIPTDRPAPRSRRPDRQPVPERPSKRMFAIAGGALLLVGVFVASIILTREDSKPADTAEQETGPKDPGAKSAPLDRGTHPPAEPGGNPNRPSGKYVPVPLDTVATAVSTKALFDDDKAGSDRLIFPDWKPKVFDGVPFVLVDPHKDTVKNVVVLNGPKGKVSRQMPKSVSLSVNSRAKAVHLLSGVSGWGALDDKARQTVSMIFRVTYDDGKTEDHELKNGVHFADYIRHVDVPQSKFAFALRKQQLRYLAVAPKRPGTVVRTIEFVKGPDETAPVVMAVTVETP